MNEQLLIGLMSPNNTLRNQAEPVFEQLLSANLEQTLGELMGMFAQQGSDVTNRSFAGILLRREIEKRAEGISESTFEKFRSYLVTMWTSETDSLILKRLCHVIAQVAVNSAWPDLIPLVLQRASSPSNSAALLSALSLLETLGEYCPDDIAAHLATLSTFLAGYLLNPDPVTQIACARATGACIISIEDESARSTFQPALEPILNVLGIALGRGDELDAQSITEHLVTIAQIQPAFFKGHLDSVVSVMLNVAGTEELDFNTRSIALELMVTISETAPALARRCPALVQHLVPLAMNLMLEVDEEEEEFIKGPYSEEPADENCRVGDEAIERVAAGLGGKNVADLVLQMATQFMADADWKKRRAAVSAVARLAEGSTKFFKKHFDGALVFLNSSLQDSSARVKFEGVQTIGRFADLYPEKISVLLEKFVPMLTALLQEGTVTCARVRGHCASALINLVNPDVAEGEDLNKHLQPLLGALVSCFSTASLEVQAPCLVLLGCIAQVSSDAFSPYYASFMPGIKSILHTAVTPELETLRGKAMECAGLIGDAVGVAVFAPDALEIMNIFIRAMQEESAKECSDTTLEYILPACARISKALKSNFAQFLPVVMPPCLAGATANIQFSMVDADVDDAEGEVIHDDAAGTESTVISLGAGQKKRVTLNTHAVQQKKQAARVIFEFADSLKGHLGSYIIPCIQATMSLATEKHSGDIRSSATLSLAKLFECYLQGIKHRLFAPSSDSEMANLGSAVLSKLLECVKGEINRTCRACAAEGYKNVLLACYNSGDELVTGARDKFMFVPPLLEIQTMAADLFIECGNCITRRNAAAKQVEVGERFDAEDVSAGRAATEEVLEEEDDILSNLTDAVGQMLKLYGAQIMPVVDKFLPALAPYADSSQPEALQMLAISFVDDIIEYGGVEAHKFIPNLVPIFIKNTINSEIEPALSQCSAYGLAKTIGAAPDVSATMFDSILPTLVRVCQEMLPHSQSDKNEDYECEREGVVQNAVLAVGYALSHCQSTLAAKNAAAIAVGDATTAAIFDVNNLATLWLQRLPLRSDEGGSKTCAHLLCDALTSTNLSAAILGSASNNANITDIIRIFAETFHAASTAAAEMARTGLDADSLDTVLFAHPDTLQRMTELLRTFTKDAHMNAQLQAVFPTLQPELQEALRGALA